MVSRSVFSSYGLQVVLSRLFVSEPGLYRNYLLGGQSYRETVVSWSVFCSYGLQVVLSRLFVSKPGLCNLFVELSTRHLTCFGSANNTEINSNHYTTFR